MSNKTRFLVGAMLLMPAIDAAHAQEAAGAGADVGLQEVVVTARKREESLQDIPIAISAISADRIERQGITRLE